MIYLDTHVVVWLYGNNVEQLSPQAKRYIEGHELLISPMVSLELDYLHEINRITVSSSAIVEDLARRIGILTCTMPFAQVIAVAREQRWTRDPFDRIIVGQAAALDRRLLTRDRNIHANYPKAVWDE